MEMRCVMRHARTSKFQLSGPTVHSLYCGHGLDLQIKVNQNREINLNSFKRQH